MKRLPALSKNSIAALDTTKKLGNLNEAFIASDANGVVLDFDSEPNYLLVNAFVGEEPPPLAGVLIGEVLYHLSSGLNHMACILTELNNQPVNDNTEFPIFWDRDAFRDPKTGLLRPAIVKRIGGIDPVKQALIEGQQPFKGLYGGFADDPLWHLYELARFDRHKALHLVSAYTDESTIEFDPPEMAQRFIVISRNLGAIKGKTEIARYAVLKGPGGNVQVDAKVRFQVAFDDGTPAVGNQPVSRILGGIAVRIGELLQLLG